MASGSSADEVADCIARAITADPARASLARWSGAEWNIRNRAALDDADWISLWNTASNDEFNTRMFAEPPTM